MGFFGLFALAVLPPIAFLVWILSADRKEPEPLHLILLTMLFGGLSVIPAAVVETALGGLFSPNGMLGAALTAFIQVSPIEEGCKLAVVLLFIWKNPNFNEENDGIVYVTSSAIGFAMLENIGYVLSYGFANGIMRALTSIPLHTFCGVIMGYWVGMAKFSANRETATRLLFRGFILAWFIHGLYDMFALSGTQATVLVIPLVIILFIVGSGLVKKGMRLSSARQENTPLTPQVPVEVIPGEGIANSGEIVPIEGNGQRFSRHDVQGWKAFVGRTLLVLCALVWLFSFVIPVGDGNDESGTRGYLLMFASLVTIIPIFIGILLELSYRRTMPDHSPD